MRLSGLSRLPKAEPREGHPRWAAKEDPGVAVLPEVVRPVGEAASEAAVVEVSLVAVAVAVVARE